MVWILGVAALVVVLVVMAVYDLFQTKHAIRRNFPLIGRLRYLIERIGPELRQYIVTSNDEERPFSRDQRRWVYSTAKNENSYFGFGTDNAIGAPNYLYIRQAGFPYQPKHENPDSVLPVAKVMGEWRNRQEAFRPQSIVNISAMSFGSLSGRAIESLNRGAAIAGLLHNTGEGGVSRHHLHGGDLIFQVGTGYFGARNTDGTFSMDRLIETVASAPVKAIEIKISQGAKPGLGGVLPGAKVTADIAAARGVQQGVTIKSPAFHREFSSVTGLVSFVERIAEATGLPVGIKSAVGDRSFWVELADEMSSQDRGPDFISIDGGEGGTGAAPLVFSDHVSVPFRSGFSEVFSIFAERGLQRKVVWFGAGKLGFPSDSLQALAMGVDVISVGREAMLAVGCIQAQKCESGHCPTGVATHSKWLVRGLDPADKASRVANYMIGLRYELLRLSHACGVSHPALVPAEFLELRRDAFTSVPLTDAYRYDQAWVTLDAAEVEQVDSLMAAAARSAHAA